MNEEGFSQLSNLTINYEERGEANTLYPAIEEVCVSGGPNIFLSWMNSQTEDLTPTSLSFTVAMMERGGDSTREFLWQSVDW